MEHLVRKDDNKLRVFKRVWQKKDREGEGEEIQDNGGRIRCIETIEWFHLRKWWMVAQGHETWRNLFEESDS